MAETTMTKDELVHELITTQRKLDMLERQVNQDQFEAVKTVLDLMPDMILMVDLDMRITWANRTALDKRPEAVGKLCYQAFRDCDEPCVNCPCAIALQTGETTAGTITLQEADDTTSHWENIGIPLKQADGSISGMLEISRNITARVLYNQKVQEYAESLEMSKQDSLAANTLKTQFLTDLIREIGTPMNAITGMLHMLEASELTKTQQEYVDVISGASRKLLTIMDNIREMSRIDSGQMALSREPFQLRSLFDELVKSYSEKAYDKGILFTSRYDSSIPKRVIGDRKRLRQALINVLDNATKFTEEGRIRFEIVTLEQKSDRLVLSMLVEDTGIGLQQNQRYNTEQGVIESSMDGADEAAGIGMAIASQIIELMNGTLQLESTKGKGTIVQMTCQLEVEPAAKSELIKSKVPKRSGKKPTILIAEDEIVGRVTYKLLLRDKYNVVFAKNGEEAVRLYFEYEPELVLMDVMMPVLNGFEALDEIESKAVARSPVIAVSSRVISTEKEYLTSYGFDDYLSKPIDSKEVERIIKLHLSKS